MPARLVKLFWERNETTCSLQVRDSIRGVPVGSSSCDLVKRPQHDDAEEEEEEEELRMLASLRRQKEEEDGSTSDPGLSASQVHLHYKNNQY